MRIDSDFKADVTGFKPHYHEETSTLCVTVAVTTEVDAKKSKEVLGDEFHRIAFGSMQESDDEGEPIFTFGYSKLSPRLICEGHMLHIAGFGPIPVQPKVKRIEPVKQKDAVLVTIDLPLFVEKQELLGALVAQYGKTIDVKLVASQGELPLDGARKVVHKNTGRYGNLEPVHS